MKNIVLIGMPGCGKSTLGRSLAEMLGRDFIDADPEIEKDAGKTIPELFAVSEDIFRKQEIRTTKRLSALQGKVLAMGGGVALSWMMRLSGREQRTIIIEIGMQNAAQAISIASSPFVFANDVMAIPAIVYALMMNIILLAYVGIVKTVRPE